MYPLRTHALVLVRHRSFSIFSRVRSSRTSAAFHFLTAHRNTIFQFHRFNISPNLLSNTSYLIDVLAFNAFKSLFSLCIITLRYFNAAIRFLSKHNNTLFHFWTHHCPTFFGWFVCALHVINDYRYHVFSANHLIFCAPSKNTKKRNTYHRSSLFLFTTALQLVLPKFLCLAVQQLPLLLPTVVVDCLFFSPDTTYYRLDILSWLVSAKGCRNKKVFPYNHFYCWLNSLVFVVFAHSIGTCRFRCL